MMHGRGKSDLAVVAGKPANKVEPSTAAPEEPRAGTEGNASQAPEGSLSRQWGPRTAGA